MGSASFRAGVVHIDRWRRGERRALAERRRDMAVNRSGKFVT
jgi:hypothetical protein